MHHQARALDLIGQHIGTEAELMMDARLNVALEPYRGTWPKPVRCSGKDPSCSRIVTYWGLPVRGEPIPIGADYRSISLHRRDRGVHAPVDTTGYVYGAANYPSAGARVIYASNAPRSEHFWADAKGMRARNWHPHPYDAWSIVSGSGPDGVHVLWDQHDPDARIFVCPRKKCGLRYRLKNSEMLTLLVLAMEAEDEDIRLPAAKIEAVFEREVR